MINTISFKKPEINKLIWIEEGNKLPNYQYFIDVILGEENVNNLFQLWLYTNKLCNNSIKKIIFHHQLGTLLLNCKKWENNTNFGMRYGSLCITTYVNNSCPDLIEISVIWPSCPNNLITL